MKQYIQSLRLARSLLQLNLHTYLVLQVQYIQEQRI
jgi:hypothetical protein